MDLKEFVSQSIIQIVEGIIIAGQDITPKGALLNPYGHYSASENNGPSDQFITLKENSIDFNVAVVIEENDVAKGGIGIFVGGVGIGTQGENKNVNQMFSRIEFSIPIIFPQHILPGAPTNAKHPKRNPWLDVKGI